jgi:dihydrofolate synthase/folylpolyglutamate synthase
MIITSYEQAQEFLESFIRPTVLQRIEEDSHMKDPLDRMRVLLRLLGDPQKKFKSVQVSGTSGKGSTSYLLANILTTAGYKTGLATSPHLERIHERMLINNREIPDNTFLDLVNLLVPAVEQLKVLPEGEPSYFELLTAMAFLYFAQEKVDIAVVEVGLEGRYDATNVLNPLIVILTNISRDHVELLGNTEEAIAGEAMSIVRKEISISPVVITGITQKNILEVLKKRTQGLGLAIEVLNQTIKISLVSTSEKGVGFYYEDRFGPLGTVYVSLRGEYQATNAALAIAASRELNQLSFAINADAIKQGLAHAFFAGRFEVINIPVSVIASLKGAAISVKKIASSSRYGGTPRNDKQLTIILDGAHNEAKMTAFLHGLDQYYPDESKIFIVGFKKNKDSSSMTRELFLRKDEFIFTQFHKGADYARSVSMTRPELSTATRGASGIQYADDVGQAIEMAISSGRQMIVITGSLYLVGEARSLLLARE